MPFFSVQDILYPIQDTLLLEDLHFDYVKIIQLLIYKFKKKGNLQNDKDISKETKD